MTTANEPKTETGMQNYLKALLERCQRVREVGTFEDRGILTTNKGLVVELENGREFQVTIVESTPRW